MPVECPKQQPNGPMPNRVIRAELGAGRLSLLAEVQGSWGHATGEALCHRGRRWVVLHAQQSPVGLSTPGLCPAVAQENPGVGGGVGRCCSPSQRAVGGCGACPWAGLGAAWGCRRSAAPHGVSLWGSTGASLWAGRCQVPQGAAPGRFPPSLGAVSGCTAGPAGDPVLCVGAVGWAQLHQAELGDASLGPVSLFLWEPQARLIWLCRCHCHNL